MKTNKVGQSASITNPQRDTIYKRIDQIDEVIVAHVDLKNAIEGILQCILWSESSREPRGAILLGLGGAGKTTVCNTILSKFPPYQIEEPHAIFQIVPAFFASVPSPSTIKSLASILLEELGDPAPLKGTASALTDRLCKLISVCKTKIILLDEFHHLFAEADTGAKQITKICNWLKTLINKTGVMICLIGVPRCEAIVNHDSQMARRFTHRYHLNELAVGSISVPGPLHGFVLTISKKLVELLELKGIVDFRESLHVQQMWAATSGNPAFICLLLKEATAIALIGGRDSVVVGDLAEAFSKGITQTAAKTSGNPFTMTQGQLNSDLSKIFGRK